jgi:serine O-acetyltransferase
VRNDTPPLFHKSKGDFLQRNKLRYNILPFCNQHYKQTPPLFTYLNHHLIENWHMIKTKQDLHFYLAADKFALGKDYRRPKLIDDVWKYQIVLRKVAYYQNNQTGLLNNLLSKYYKFRKYKLGIKLGFDIGPNSFGAGLRLNHFGNIVVNPGAKLGMWCDVHQGVNIGANRDLDNNLIAPVVGNNVWIGPGVKIFGNIELGSNIAIGANAVVNKNFSSNCTIAGIPGKVAKESGTEKLNVAASKTRMKNFFTDNPKYERYNPLHHEEQIQN